MNNNILIIYKSYTGFTKEYAEMIAEELGCKTAALNTVTAKTIAAYETIIFGGRFHAGKVDGLKKVREFLTESPAKKLIVFATGATPIEAEEMIQEAWKTNFTPAELSEIPHFYMPSGLRYERMSFGDKMLMKAFAAVLKKSKAKDSFEEGMQQAISGSFDHSSKEYIKPLLSYLK